jgi:hypothetical protein
MMGRVVSSLSEQIAMTFLPSIIKKCIKKNLNIDNKNLAKKKNVNYNKNISDIHVQGVHYHCNMNTPWLENCWGGHCCSFVMIIPFES